MGGCISKEQGVCKGQGFVRLKPGVSGATRVICCCKSWTRYTTFASGVEWKVSLLLSCGYLSKMWFLGRDSLVAL